MNKPSPSTGNWVVRLNYRNRSLSFMLMLGVLVLHLADQQPSVLIWTLLGLHFLVYPHILYRLVLRSRHKLGAETRGMLLDAALFGCWVAVMGFPLWISFVMLLAVHINLISFRGVRGLLHCMLATLGGVAFGWAVPGIQFAPESNMPATLACMLALTLYLLTVSNSAYLRSISLRATREKLRQSGADLQQKLEEINSLQIQLRELVNRDPLTGLYNRRYLDSELSRTLQRDQSVQPLCLLMIDIDHFKKINDEFGHQAGDQVLARLAGVLTSHCRREDVVCRYGGEEFVILMPGLTLPGAQQRAERIRRAFADMEVRIAHRPLKVSLSIGLAIFPAHGATPEALFRCADKALYQAKAEGRNRTVLWQPLNPVDAGAT